MMHLLARIYDYSNTNNYSVILTGDFNTESNSETCKLLSNSGYNMLSNAEVITYPKRNCTIDFIFGLRKRFKTINQIDLSTCGLNFYSDHNPVCCLIEILNSNIIVTPETHSIQQQTQQQQQQIPTTQSYLIQQYKQKYTLPMPQKLQYTAEICQQRLSNSHPNYAYYQQQQQLQQLPRSIYLPPKQMVISNEITSNPPPVLNTYQQRGLYSKQPVYASNVVKKQTGYLPSQYSQPPQPIRYQ